MANASGFCAINIVLHVLERNYECQIISSFVKGGQGTCHASVTYFELFDVIIGTNFATYLSLESSILWHALYVRLHRDFCVQLWL